MLFSVSNTGLSPAMAEFSNSLLLPNYKSFMLTLQPLLNEFNRFGLFPFRSPLLRESRLISFPSVTEMFHFTELALDTLCIHVSVTGHDSRRVSPFRNFRFIECLASPRNLSQLTASFIAFRHQGIHPMLLSTCFSKKNFSISFKKYCSYNIYPFRTLFNFVISTDLHRQPRLNLDYNRKYLCVCFQASSASLFPCK